MQETKRGDSVLAGSGLGEDADWRAALATALEGALAPLDGDSPSLLFLFAGEPFRNAFGELLREAGEVSAALEIVGCSGSGVIGVDRELEGRPAVAALALKLPRGAFVNVARVDQSDVQVRGEGGASRWTEVLGLQPGACTGLIVLADPFTVDVDALIDGLSRDYPGVPVVGGLASGNMAERGTHVFCGSKVYTDGAVVVGLSGSVRLRPVVSQGCEPIGEPWTVTGATGHVLETIGSRPAYEVLVRTLESLSDPERARASRNLLIGLAIDEYRDEFKRGDFLIRNLMRVDSASGALAIAALPRVGQTVQFQVRDARAADEELRHLLGEAATELARPPAAALLFACNGRGSGLFSAPNHDARAANDLLGAPPLAGFFCNGEIGPVGGATYLHGFTASFGLIVPTASND